MSLGISRLSSLLLIAAYASAYTWPNPQLDELESLLFDQQGYNERGILVGALNPCDRFNFGDTVNRSNVADWIRTAYHDMATHNAEDGTGGLDASIQFEQDRPENAGNGFFNALRHLQLGISRYVGVADFIALGAKTAFEQCDGPTIPFRGGRVDATEAGPPGVPQPQESLDSHISSFARQGFNQTEMITLVACGHSFGGVQHSAFPDTVPLPAGVDDVSQTFDSTPFNFDNNVALEYVHGTTNNPLVVGHNDTTNSDKRIFGSDGNATISGFAADSDSFRTACQSLFARMLDTVPSTVQLTEVIEPLPVKPQDIALLYMGDGTLRLSGQVRFWNVAESDAPSVKLIWADREGKTDSSYTGVLGHNDQMVASALYNGNVSALWYNIGPLSTNFTVVNETVGISKFWFEVSGGDSSIKTEHQNGVGFPIQDTVMLANSSCTAPAPDGLSSIAHIQIAVRADAHPSRVWLEYDLFNGDAGSGATWITVNTTDAQLATNQTQADSIYELWSVDLPSSALASSNTRKVNIAAEIGSLKITTTSFSTSTLAHC
ncbi:heme peroxidase [Dichomitus squalens LYAD-421 SS1]|uniref:Peroxidase n=1 Tax=Dichomitus squalens (strain LYAD-421) TaxID=732165 RepID=R7SY69_DICSQ|nr:heme peroxidase [Dichomitus squalens LYAD-421 SS1]EJF61036.1 heme peroxidase [Dichomitus squalens LYAD-421 SS1]